MSLAIGAIKNSQKPIVYEKHPDTLDHDFPNHPLIIFVT